MFNKVQLLLLFLIVWPKCVLMISMKQFDDSLEAIRSACAPQFKVTTEQIDNLRVGVFEENKELMCYTKCVAQMAGTLNKKGELSLQKSLAQIDMLLPVELKDDARNALNACKDIQNNYKNPCEKLFFITKCVYEFNPAKFKFP